MRDWATRHRWESILIVVLAMTIVVNVALSPFYLGFGNFVNLFWLSIEKIIVVVVMTFVIINGEIDLSVASVMGFSAAVTATVYNGDVVPFAVAILIGIAAGAIAGLLQGLVITRFGLPSLVVTLAGLIGFRGAARVLLEDRSVGDFPEWFERIGQQTLVGPFPVALVIFFVGLALAWVILERSAFGRKVYVIGNSADVARFSGIEVDWVKLRLFIASGTIAGVAGILFAARVGAVQGTLGETYELDIITMVLLGGVSIFGGSGSMLGVVLALFTVLNIRNGLGLANIDGITQTGVIGLLLIGSVLVPNLAERYRLRRPRTASTAPEAIAHGPP
ncbi:MAG TPA: ABC transporter permease [Acidimicrobiia bacterium]|nr:ABC transporter permease [Acidimicrobiia bacterium]